MAVTARIDELRRKFEENPRRYFAPLANEYRKAGDLESAIAICRRELAAFPEHISGHIVLGQALYEAGRRREAQSVFEAALGLDPENLIALRHLGDLARAEGDDSAARRWYGRILDADPRNDDIASLLASVAGDRGARQAPAAEPPSVGRSAFGDVLGEAVQREAPAEAEGFVGGWDIPAFQAPAPEARQAPPPDPSIPVVSGPISEPPGPSVLPHLSGEEDQFLDDLVDEFVVPSAPAAGGGPAAPPAEETAVAAEEDLAGEEVAGDDVAAEGTVAEAPLMFEELEAEPAHATAAQPEAADAAAALEIPEWVEAAPDTLGQADLLDAELEPVVGLDVPPVADSAQVQLGAADLEGVELPAAEMWAAELAAAEPALESARAGAMAPEEEDEGEPWEPPRADEPAPRAEEPAAVEAVEAGEALQAEEPGAPDVESPEAREDELDLDVALIEAAPPGGAADAPAEPRPAPAAPVVHDDAHVDAEELSALTSGAFATETLAELFVQQGHLDQAVAIYERLAAERPDEPAVERRLRAVRRMAAGEPPEPEPEPTRHVPTAHEYFAALAARTAGFAPAGERARPQPAVAERPRPVEQPRPVGPPVVQPPVEQSPVEQSPVEQSPIEQPAVEQMAVEQSPDEKPGVELSAIGQPATGQPATGQPAVKQPAVEQPVVETAAVAEPVVDEVAAEPPVAGQAVEPPPEQGAEPLLAGAASDADDRAAHLLARAYSAPEGAPPSLLDDLAAVAADRPAPEAAPAAEPPPDDLSFDRFFAGFEDLLDAEPQRAAAEAEEPLVVAGEGAEPALPTAAPVADAGRPAVIQDAERPAESADEDLAKFNAWLKGLGDL